MLGVLGLIIGLVGVVVGIVGVLVGKRSLRMDEQARAKAEQTTALLERISHTLGIPANAMITPMDGQLVARDGDARYAISLADINADRADELLVATPWGPHSSMLHVYGQADATIESFTKLGELGAGTPLGFTVGDLDGDGLIEVSAIQPEGDKPYALGEREEVLYRWDGRNFSAVDRASLPGPEGDPAAPMRWHDGSALLNLRGPRGA